MSTPDTAKGQHVNRSKKSRRCNALVHNNPIQAKYCLREAHPAIPNSNRISHNKAYKNNRSDKSFWRKHGIGAFLQGRFRFKDVCKRDLKHSSRRKCLRTGGAEKLLALKRSRQSRQRKAQLSTSRQASVFTCTHCNRNNHSRIGLFSHNRRWQKNDNQRALIIGLPRPTSLLLTL